MRCRHIRQEYSNDSWGGCVCVRVCASWARHKTGWCVWVSACLPLCEPKLSPVCQCMRSAPGESSHQALTLENGHLICTARSLSLFFASLFSLISSSKHTRLNFKNPRTSLRQDRLPQNPDACWVMNAQTANCAKTRRQNEKCVFHFAVLIPCLV